MEPPGEKSPIRCPRRENLWCGGGDLNPYALRRKHLKLVRLPISPPPQRGNLRSIAKCGLWNKVPSAALNLRRRRKNHRQMQCPPSREPRCLVDANRARIGRQHMQNGRLALYRNSPRDSAHQRQPITPSPKIGMRADRADLGKSRQRQPLPSHGSQPPILANPQKSAQVVSPWPERPRFGKRRQLQHLRYIVRTERLKPKLPIASLSHSLANHLIHRLMPNRTPPSRQFGRRVEKQRGSLAGRRQIRQRTISLRALLHHSSQRPDPGLESPRQSVTLAKACMASCQRMPDRIVERLEFRFRSHGYRMSQPLQRIKNCPLRRGPESTAASTPPAPAGHRFQQRARHKRSAGPAQAGSGST
jgi:hypothetical protein